MEAAYAAKSNCRPLGGNLVVRGPHAARLPRGEKATYKAGRLSTTGSATKKRGVKNEKCHAFDALLRGASAWPLGTL